MTWHGASQPVPRIGAEIAVAEVGDGCAGHDRGDHSHRRHGQAEKEEEEAEEEGHGECRR